MLCGLVEPGSPHSALIVEEHCLSPEMAALDLPSMTHGVVVPHSDICDSGAASPSPSSPLDATRDSSPRPQRWERRDTSPANVDNVPIRDPASQGVMEESIQPWSYPPPSLSAQNDDFQPHHGPQSPSALRGASPSLHSDNPSFISEYPHDLPVAAVSEPDETSIKGESLDSDDPTLGLVHPIPRPPSLFLASSNMALFLDFKMELEPPPFSSSPAESNEECLVDHGIVPKPDWTVEDLGTAPLFNEPSPGRAVDTFVDTSLTSMDPTCSPDSLLSWSPLNYQTGFGMPHHSINHNDILFSSGPELFNVNDHYDHVSAGFNQTTSTVSDFHGLTLLNSESPSYLQPSVHLNPCRPDLPDIPTTRDTMMLNGGSHEHIFVPADTLAYQESLFRLNQLTHPRFALDTSHLRQQLLGNRTFSCPSETRNAFLIECKRRGLSYKDIKRLGGFKEAESTLRGRFRTLTKSKDQRVRKPHWHDNDIRLLCEAVNACSETGKCCPHPRSSSRRSSIAEPPKVPWKRVAQYIRAHGGSYHFGNATCKKKWCEVHDVKV